MNSKHYNINQLRIDLWNELKEKTNAIDLDFAKGYYQYKVIEGNKVLKADKLIIQ